MVDRNHERIFVSWVKQAVTRSESLAKHLGAESHCVRSLESTHIATAPVRWLLNGVKTWQLLSSLRPTIVLIQNPPVFAVLVVWAYCLRSRARYVIDTHSAAFTWRRWVAFSWLHAFLARRAVVNLLHNEPMRQRVLKWGAPAMVLGDIPFLLPTSGNFAPRSGFNAAVISSYERDEPLEVVWGAARHLPDVTFFVTGDNRRAPKYLISERPANLVLTGFLPPEEYAALLQSCDVVVCLTTDDETMQNGAYEAMALERPVITSDWPVLRDLFVKGAVCIRNNPRELMQAIDQVRHDHARFVSGIRELRVEVSARFQKDLEYLNGLLEAETAGS